MLWGRAEVAGVGCSGGSSGTRSLPALQGGEERGSWVWEKAGAARGWGEDSPAKREKSLTMDSGRDGV